MVFIFDRFAQDNTNEYISCLILSTFSLNLTSQWKQLMSECVGIISVDLFLGFGVGGVARRPLFLCTSSLASLHAAVPAGHFSRLQL